MTTDDKTIRRGTIVSLSSDGSGVLRSAGEKVVFVPGALPGEDVVVRLHHEYRRHATARLLEVTKPSDQRVTPPCRHYSECGGCHLQHLDPNAHGQLKRNWFLDACRRIGRLPEDRLSELETKLSTVALPVEGYRVRGRLHLTPSTIPAPSQPPGHRQQTTWTLGYAKRDESFGTTPDCLQSTVSVSSCTILHPVLEACLKPIQGILREGSDLGLPMEPLQLELTLCHGPWPEPSPQPQPQVAMTLYRQGRRRLALKPFESRGFFEALARTGLPLRVSSQHGEDLLCCKPSPPTKETLPFPAEGSDAAPFPSHRLGFVQPHESAPAVYRGWLRTRALEAFMTEQEKGPKAGPRELWDLYAGSGLLGLALAHTQSPREGSKLFDHLVCVEDNAQALAASPQPLHGQSVEHLALSTDTFLARALGDRRSRAPRWVIADPPRTGLGLKTTENLVRCLKTLGPSGRKDVFLISCDGAAAARDLADLTKQGLILEQVVLVDAFGYTRHYEVLSHLVFLP